MGNPDELDKTDDPRRILRQLFRSRTFVALLTAEFQSVIGDQLARVALAVLVFNWSDSASLTAATYAATFVPALIGGLFLTRLGDRFPRVPVMVGCDLVRAGLFAAMALPGLNIGTVIALLVVAVVIGPIFGATQISYLSTVLSRELFGSATGMRLLSDQSSQVVGFAVGGLVVAAIGPRPALLCNAASFVVSAGLVLLAARGQRRAPVESRSGETHRLRTTARWFIADPGRLSLLGLSALAGLFVVPEGLAVPFAHQVGAMKSGTGPLLASIPLGSAVGAAILVRFVPVSARPRVACLAAGLCGVPLLVMAIVPSWPVAAAMWLLSGVLSAYQVVVITSVAHLAPAHHRAAIMGFGGAIVVGAQGAGLLVFGAMAQWLDPARSIAAAGGAGSALAVVLVAVGLRGWWSPGQVPHSVPLGAKGFSSAPVD